MLKEKDTLEELSGVQIRKPADRMKAAENESQSAAPQLSETGRLFQKTKLFGRLADPVLIELCARGEERTYKAGDVLCREGEKQPQHWLGMLLSGQLICQFSEQIAGSDGQVTESANRLDPLLPGTLFGELVGLQIREAHTSTITAEVESRVFVIESQQIWTALESSPDDTERLMNDCDCIRAFLYSKLAATCHIEIAYQLRGISTMHTLLPGEELVLGGSGTIENSSRKPRACAVVERGAILIQETDEVLEEGGVACDAALLGVKGSCTLSCQDGPANIALINRVQFWNLIAEFPKEKDSFIKMALDRLPPATSDISSVPLLQQLEGQQGFYRLLQGLTKQRIVLPGKDVVSFREMRDTLSFVQSGHCDIFVQGHKVRELPNNSTTGDLNFMGVLQTSNSGVVATDFCILQELRRKDIESNLAKHHGPRSRWRELIKLKNVFKQESQVERQHRMLRETSFFGDEVPAEFMKDMHKMMEPLIYFAGQKIVSEDGPDDTMFLLVEGSATRSSPGTPDWTVGAGAVVGSMGLLCKPFGPRELMTASSICCVLSLQRLIFMEALKKHPDVKPHFEDIAREYMKVTSEENEEESANIYSMPFFRDCGSRFLYLLDLHLDRHIFFSDEVIVQENTEGEEMYILYTGTMDVKVRGMKVGKLEGGMCFGEMAVLGLVKMRSASIVAVSLCDVRILSRKSLEESIKEFPEELARFEGLAATRKRMTIEQSNGGQVRHLSSFFQDCKPEFAKSIAEEMQDRLFTRGQVIMKEGEDGDSLFLLHQGSASVELAGEKVATLKSGDIVGELVVLGLANKRTCTVTASETCFVQELSRSSLMPILKRFPAERQILRQLAAQRMEWKYIPDTVRGFEFFKASPRGFTDLIDQRMKRWIFFKGDVMLQKGAQAESLIMLCTGHVQVEMDGTIIRELREGDVLGELGAFGFVDKRSATVRCKEICDVYVISREALIGALEQYPEQEERFRHLATWRMRSDVERKSERNVLLNCPLFQQSSRKFLDRIAAHLEDKLFVTGENLCVQGEKGETMFILVQGEVDVLIGKEQEEEERVVNQLLKGAVIGEIAVLGLSDTRTATLRAKVVCLVQVLHRSILMKYLAEFPREIAQFQEVGAARLAKTGIKNKNLFPSQALFKDCQKEFLDELGQLLQRKIFFPKQTIVKEGHETNDMLALSQGRASMEKGGELVDTIKEGECFGEMAVMRVNSTSPATIKAEMMCDMQSLSCFDLETLLDKYPDEKVRLLSMIASTMREELAEVTNLEILSEVPLLAELGSDFIKKLNEVAKIKIARQDEPIRDSCQNSFFVLLQGRASVVIGGEPTRELSEGDCFGEAMALGLSEAPGLPMEVPIYKCSVCLYLEVSEEDMRGVLQGPISSRIQELAKAVDVFRELREKVVVRHTGIAHLKLKEDQLAQVRVWCEELFFVAGQEVWPAEMQKTSLFFMLAGKATYTMGRHTRVLEPGSTLGELTNILEQKLSILRAKPAQIVATSHCKVLILHKHAMAKFISQEPPEERDRIQKRLETAEEQNQSHRGSCFQPATIRQIANLFTTQCFQDAKAGLKAKVKPWNAPKEKKAKTKFGKRSSKSKLDVDDDDSPRSSGTASSLKKRQAPASKVPPATAKSVVAKRLTVTSPIKLQVRHRVKLSEQDKQERVFCQDMRRLIGVAQIAMKDAQGEQEKLKQQVGKIRADIKAAKKAARAERVFFGRDGMSSAETVQEQVVKKKIRASQKRIEQLRQKLAEAFARRQELLNQMKGDYPTLSGVYVSCECHS